jgi:hypothetical protein
MEQAYGASGRGEKCRLREIINGTLLTRERLFFVCSSSFGFFLIFFCENEN